MCVKLKPEKKKPEKKKIDFPRFSELNSNNVLRDLQIHTNWTDGESSVKDLLEQADRVGLKEIGFTEHARHNSTYYPEFFDEIDFYAEKFPNLVAYKGFEVKIKSANGCLDMSNKMRDAAELVLGSVHSMIDKPSGRRVHPKEMDLAVAVATETELSLGLIENGGADVLSHPGGMSLRFHGEFPFANFDLLLSRIKHTTMAFELNYAYHSRIMPHLLELVAKHDPFVSIGSDVHNVHDMGKCSAAILQSLRI